MSSLCYKVCEGIIPSELKKYLFDHKWTVLYSDSIKMENDDELTDFIRSEEIPVIETDEEFDRFLEEYYKVHPTNSNKNQA
jgi:hypothetical protein